MLDPKSPGFSNIKHLIRRIEANPYTDSDKVVSVKDSDVPAWQRQTVWSEDEMGLLAYSIIRQYPIGIVILWQKDSGIRVPIDGRQRLTAIYEFFKGNVAIPDLPSVEKEYRKKKFTLQSGDKEKGFTELEILDKEYFEDYQLKCVEYQGLSESVAMDIFVMLQGGKSLTKTEVRAALGGELCDFITELTSGTSVQDEDTDDEEASKHEFFQKLAKNMPNRRKAHRNMADIMVHEVLYPGEDKHWSSLESMYREKVSSLSKNEKKLCRDQIASFLKATTVNAKGTKILMPQLKSAHLILSVFRAWVELNHDYDVPKDNSFSDAIRDFETQRQKYPDDKPWINFTSALSNAGYAKNRISSRHDILMTFILQNIKSIEPKSRDSKRLFTTEQKIAIWENANHQCEWVDTKTGDRCTEIFPNFKEADADHIVMWRDNGRTTVENGRLLCPKHNRSRKV